MSHAWHASCCCGTRPGTKWQLLGLQKRFKKILNLYQGLEKGKYCFYQRPTAKRVNNSIVLVVDKHETTENTKLVLNAVCITFRRPQVSAINPQKCEVNTTPMKATALIRPCSLMLRFNSHLAAGNTNAMLIDSRTTESNAIPDVSSKAKWNRPEPLKKNISFGSKELLFI